jgi:hypothetical protein
MTTQSTRSTRSTRSRTNSLDSLNTSFYEEDTYSADSFADSSFFSENSNLSELSKDTLLKICPDPSSITLENYEESDINDLFIIRLQKSSGKFSEKGECMTKTELLQNLQQDRVKIANLVQGTDVPPKNFMSIAISPKDNNKTGIGYKPTSKIVVLLNLSNSSIFITLGSLKRIITENNKIWYAMKLFNGKRRRVGNLSGISTVVGSNHAQIPGYYIYKLFTKNEIENGVHVHEELSDYFLDDTDLQFYKTFDAGYLLNIFDRYFFIHELLDRPPTPSSELTPRASNYPTYVSPSYIGDSDEISIYSSSMYTEGDTEGDLTTEDLDDSETNESLNNSVILGNTNDILEKDSVFSKFSDNILSIQSDNNILYADTFTEENGIDTSSTSIVKIWNMNTSILVNKFKISLSCPIFIYNNNFYYICKNKLKSRNIAERDRNPIDDTLVFYYTGDGVITDFKIYKWTNKLYLVAVVEEQNEIDPTQTTNALLICNLDTQQGQIIAKIPIFTWNLQKFVYNNQGELFISTTFNTLEVFSLVTGTKLSQVEFTDNTIFSKMIYFNRHLYILFKQDNKLYRVSKNNENYITSIINLPSKIKTFVISNNILIASTKTRNEFFITTLTLINNKINTLKVKSEIDNMTVYQNSLFYDQGTNIITRQIKITRPPTPTLMLPNSIRNAFS